MLRIDDPSRAAAIAATIDERFANSRAETKTSTEKAFVQDFASQVGDVGAIISAILGTVLFTILLVAANAMAQAIRERTSELAVMKTVGFSDRRILALVLAESLLLAGVGGGLGLGIGALIIALGDPTGGYLPVFLVPARDFVLGGGLVVALGLAAGCLPALQATRLRIVEALRKP